MTKRRSWEIAIVVIVIVLAGVAIWSKIYSSREVVKDAVLVNQLRAVRTATEFYLKVNNKYPADLSALTKEQYHLFGKGDRYLTGISVDKDGYPVDSYGFRFIYEPKTGYVELAKREYEGW